MVGVKYEDLVNHAKEFGFDPESSDLCSRKFSLSSGKRHDEEVDQWLEAVAMILT